MRILANSPDRQIYNYEDNFHFYASNAGEWLCSQDLEWLIKEMKKRSKLRDGTKLHFWVFYIPKPIESTYEINRYQPQVEGAIFLGEYQ